MNKKNKALLKDKIEELIAQSEADVRDMEQNTQAIAPENSIGRISRMDAINNKSVMEAALRNKHKKLNKLKISLSRIEEADFGLCARCKTEIQWKRLIFLPESDLCVRCASR